MFEVEATLIIKLRLGDCDVSISITDVAEYIVKYIQAYRTEYRKFIDGGYPDINLSPYLNSKELHCYLSYDGAVIADSSKEPNYRWEIAGGPALMVDYSISRTPNSIIELLKKKGYMEKILGYLDWFLKSLCRMKFGGGDYLNPLV